MPLVNIMVNSRAFTVACDDGEEEHLRELGAHVDAKIRELLEDVGQVGDARLILMAALLITDDYFDAVNLLDEQKSKVSELSTAQDEVTQRIFAHESNATAALEAAARRAEDIARRMAQA